MQCTAPVLIMQPYKNPLLKGLNRKKFPRGITVPCGKCLACRIAKSREWAVRVLHEMSSWDKCVFITLTYNEDNIPPGGSISKDELQRFFKRLRKTVSPGKIKYYACGEYGDKTKRPHYHAIIFGLGLLDQDMITHVWNRGFVHVGSVTYDSARYVSGYIDKKFSGKLEEEVYSDQGLETPFQLLSNGIGKEFCIDNKEKFNEDLGLYHHGIKLGLPRYYKNIIDIDKDKLLDKGIEIRMKLYNKLYDRGNKDLVSIETAIDNAQKQNEMTLKSKSEIARSRKRKF